MKLKFYCEIRCNDEKHICSIQCDKCKKLETDRKTTTEKLLREHKLKRILKCYIK